MEVEFVRNGRKSLSEKIEDARMIIIDRPIDDQLASYVIMNMLGMDSDNNAKPIQLYINSPGGSITAGIAILDTMSLIASPVHTTCIGMAASMAAVILAAGTKDHRRITPNSDVMIHQASGGYQGKVEDIRVHYEFTQKLYDRLVMLMAQYTGQQPDKLTTDMRLDNFMNAQEALEYGIVDEIITKPGVTDAK